LVQNQLWLKKSIACFAWNFQIAEDELQQIFEEQGTW